MFIMYIEYLQDKVYEVNIIGFFFIENEFRYEKSLFKVQFLLYILFIFGWYLSFLVW